MSQMDRSSEERSRFEKWALEEWHDCEYANSIDTDYRDADTAKMWDAWQARAALEDRQEAAPDKDCICIARGSTVPECEIHGWVFKHGGAPSEATPSKENAPPSECTCGVGWDNAPECKMHKAAPAPEVQGTPTKEFSGKVLHCEEHEIPLYPDGTCPTCCDSEGEPFILDMQSTYLAVPVGTPQKETPTMPYGAGAQNFGAAPEGVQGTFEERYAEKDQALEERARAYENTDGSDSVYSLLAGFAFQERKAAYLSGEAAGRRSAITEMEEWAEGSVWDKSSRESLLAKCAELLGEKNA